MPHRRTPPHLGRHALLVALCCLTAVATPAAFGQAKPNAARADEPRATQRLRDVVAEAKKLSEKDYDIESWNGMRVTLRDAQRVAENQDATAADVNRALSELTSAVSALVKRAPPPDRRPRLGLSASLFATSPGGPVNNVSLMWAAADPCDRFDVRRATNEKGPFKTIYTGTGTSFHDYAIADGTAFYQVVASRDAKTLSSNVASVTPMPMPEGLNEFSNQTANKNGLPGRPIKAGDTYYDFRVERDGKALKHVMMRTSKDGKSWQDASVVMDQSSHPDLSDFKFEAENRFYDKVNDQIVWWCHWERANGYRDGKAFVATAKPGQPFKVHHIYNPLGVQVRDMSVFIDDDNKGYLVAASNVTGQGANATLYIFELNATYDDVVKVTSKAVEDGYREAPHIVKEGGFYYLLFSQAAGWFPSRGGYVSSKAIEGPWGEPRPIGNPSTFSSQSGGVIDVGTAGRAVPVMMGNRWVRGEGTSRHSALPIHFADGFAFDDYAPTLLYDASKGVLLPLQAGRLLSQNRPAEASIPGKAGHEANRAFDGDYESFFQSDKKAWPFTLTTDLGSPSTVRNVQISWFLHKGSEAFYTYTIDGSMDGKTWSVLLDRSDKSDAVLGKTYGFTSDLLPENSPKARYVRVTVKQAHLHNNPSNWYPPTVYEIKVFGEKE